MPLVVSPLLLALVDRETGSSTSGKAPTPKIYKKLSKPGPEIESVSNLPLKREAEERGLARLSRGTLSFRSFLQRAATTHISGGVGGKPVDRLGSDRFTYFLSKKRVAVK